MPLHLTTPKGVIQTGTVIVLFGSGSYGAEVQRSTDWGDAPYGDWTTIAQLDRVEDGGTPVFDYQPLDGLKRWYRARHVAAGFADGPWYEPVDAIPESFPTIDWTSKPWLLANVIPLRLQMDLVSETTSSLHVQATINDDPASLADPVVSVYSYTGIPSAPTPSGSNGWVIQKPSSGFGRVTFTNYVPGRIGAFDSFDILSALTQLDPDEFLTLKLTPTNVSATTTRISASVDNPLSVPFGIGIEEYYNVGTITPVSTYVWDVGRPTSGVGTVTFHVSSSTAGIVGDYDTVYLDKDSLYALNVQCSVVSTDVDSVVTDTVVRDPLNTTSTLSGISLGPTYLTQTGVTVTLNSTTPSTGYTTYRHTITRPVFGQGTGRVTFTATKSGYLSDSDSIELPERPIYPLDGNIKIIGGTDTTIIYAITGSDALNGAAPTGSYSITPTTYGGLVSFLGSGSAVSGSTVINGAFTSSLSFTTASYEITQPTGSMPGIFEYTFYKTGRGDFVLDTVVPPLSSGSVGGSFPSSIDYFFVTGSNVATSELNLMWVGSNEPAGVTYEIFYQGPDEQYPVMGPSGVTSPYNISTITYGGYSMVAKGTPGYIQANYNLSLRMMSGSVIKASKDSTATINYAP